MTASVSSQLSDVSGQPGVAVQVRQISLALLDANPLNPRRTMDFDALEELGQSIRQSGITQPLLVRPSPASTNRRIPELGIAIRWEIVCGHRRLEAATQAGLITVPCIVREMTDAQAAEIALVDNLQRVDVAALEEAEAFSALLALHGSVEAVASRVGKDVSHVARRLKLCTLGVWQRDALREKLITVDHALLLARLGIDEQDAGLKWALDRNAGVKTPVDKVIAASIKSLAEGNANRYYGAYWEPQSVLHLKQHIEETSGRKLARAPWNLDAINLNEEGMDCSTCPSNTKANTALFSDLDIEEATCADGGCFERKRAAFVQIQLCAAGEDTHVKPPRYVARLSWKQSSVEPGKCFNDVIAKGAMSMTANPAKVLRQGQWIEAKKGGCPNARVGVTVDWSDDANRGYMGSGKKLRKPGELLLVCIAVGCKVHRKEYEKPKGENTNSRQDPAAKKAAAAKHTALVVEESKLRLAVASQVLEAVAAMPNEALRKIVIAAVRGWGDDLKVAEALMPGYKKTLQTAKIDSVEFARAVAVVSLDELSASGYIGPESGREKFLLSAKRLGWKGPDPWQKPAAPKPLKNKVADKALREKVAAMAKEATAKPAAKKKFVLSAGTKKRVADAQKKRWAVQAKARVAKKSASS
jgi:ParB/RepB/Spo0J family partition protein